MREVVSPGSRWQSAQRPLLVRTVWVDGLRHAILSPGDEVAVISPRIVATTTPPSPASLPVVKAPSPDRDLAKCLVRWALVAQEPTLEDRVEEDTPPPPSSTASSPPSLSSSQVSSRPPSPSRATPPPTIHATRQYPPRLLTPLPPPRPPPPIALCDRVIQWLDLAQRFPPPSSQPLLPVQTTAQFNRPRVVASAQRTPPSANTPKRRVLTARRSASFGDTLPQRNRPAVIQVYRTDPPTIPLRAWVTDTPRTKPQLHIFVPAVERKRSDEEAGESSVE